jgi:hypothetical protein
LAGAGIIVVVVVAIVALLLGNSGGDKASPPPATSGRNAAGGTPSTGTGFAAGHRGAGSTAIAAIEAGVVPWTLAAPVSREVVLPSGGSVVAVVGGLASSQATVPTVYSLDTNTGTQAPLPSLASGVHDASGALVGGKALLFGGGSPSTVATVQQFVAPIAQRSNASPSKKGRGGATTTTTSAPSTTTQCPPSVVGQLPQPRSDSEAVTIGASAYIVGGYDGTNADAEVLATPDGHRFTVAAKLPVPVRYPAVASYGGAIYAFGGEAVGGAQSGQAVDLIQRVDPARSSAAVVGHMAQPVVGAVAAVLGGHIYVAGGAASTSQASPPLNAVWAYDAVHHKMLNAGTLPLPTSYAAATVVGPRAWIVGGESAGQPLRSVEMMVPNTGFGTAGKTGAGSPYYGGRLLVADRGNDRLLLIDTQNKIVWSYPSVYAAPPPGGFYFPDDAFFTKNGTQIISNQEENQTIVMIGFPSGQLLWSYGHPRRPGSASGYLHTPDDAYLLKNGQIAVADADNCRVVVVNQDGSVASQIGTTGSCVHNPPTSLGSPNGDTPLADGNFLISEINGSWVSEYTPQGKLVWTLKLPVGYPSDPQQLGPDLYLVSDYSHPGGFIEFTREGQVTYRYQPPTGLGEMNKPSLTEVLPSGVFLSNDDYRDRMIAVDPATQALVWQYGVTDTSGTSPGYLNTPDGFDLLMDNGAMPLHPYAG